VLQHVLQQRAGWLQAQGPPLVVIWRPQPASTSHVMFLDQKTPACYTLILYPRPHGHGHMDMDMLIAVS
jgi:hypothetical protein